jgi:2-polyprenyl-6-methoxyphenol hydroxylase-like FAD-dependent oxidoreductase
LGLHALKHGGGTLVRLAVGRVLPGHSAFGVHRSVLFEALRAAVAAADVELRLGVEIVRWEPGMRSGVAIDREGKCHGEFDLLVAADGGRSALRKWLYPALDFPEYAFGAIWAVGPCESVRGYLHQVTRGAEHLVGLLPLGGARCNLFWSLPVSQFDTVRRRGFAAWRAEVLALCPLAEELFAELDSFEQASFTTYRRVVLPTVVGDRMVLIGDAGHAMSPHLGQGANLALLDAECLAAALTESAALPDALQHYEAARARQIAYYATLSHWLTPFFQSHSQFCGAARDLGLPLLCRFPPTRARMELAMAGVRTGWLLGRLPPKMLPRVGSDLTSLQEPQA